MGLGAPLPPGKRGTLTPTPAAPLTPPSEAGPVLLYDGACGVCARSIQFILRHEGATHSLRFAALQSDFGRRILDAVPGLEEVDSVVWVEPAPTDPGSEAPPPRLVPGAPIPPLRVLVRSDAALAAAIYLGGGWRWVGRVGRLVPRGLRDAVYDLVARNRHRMSDRSKRCLLPTPEERLRFLDGPDAPPGAGDDARDDARDDAGDDAGDPVA
jgi:predicted DCC family thiol-disulfide oxidoreductase YuxK